MHTNRVKAKVDFKFCMGNIPAMLRATKPVLSEKQYKELCNEVNKADGYLEQKRIIFKEKGVNIFVCKNPIGNRVISAACEEC